MKPTIGLFLFIVNIFSFLSAQSAEQILEKASSKISSNITFAMNFQYKMTNSNGQIIAQGAGNLYTVKEKFYLDLPDVRQIYNGKKLYTINKEDKEVTIQTPSETSDDFLSPTKILSSYKKGYKYTLLSNSGGLKKIQLTPINTSSNIKTISLTIDQNNELVKYFQINKDKSQVDISIKKYIENLIIASSLFKFDSKHYKEYMITDLD